MSRVVSLLFHDVYVGDPSESGFRSPAADRYKLPSVAFDRQLEGLAGAAAPCRACDLLKPWPRRPAWRFLITVDDGGLSYYTEIADRLEARDWRGSCFVSTDFIGRPGFLCRRQLRELDRRDHLIGSHSASHPTRFSACDRRQMRAEWRRSREELENILGHPVVIASLPGGYFSRAVAATAAEAGYCLLFTSTPTTALRMIDGCLIAGRFTLRRGSHPDAARRLVRTAPWTRGAARAAWCAKSLVKVPLGPAYPRVADLLATGRAVGRQPG